MKITKEGQRKDEEFYPKDPNATPARNRSANGLRDWDCVYDISMFSVEEQIDSVQLTTAWGKSR